MHFLRLLCPVLLLFAGNMGCSNTVEGSGPADDDARDENIQRVLGAMSSAGPLFDCTFEAGSWPRMTPGSRITLMRTGAFVTIDGRQLRLERVDRSPPNGGYFSYLLASADRDESISVSGVITNGRAAPSAVYFYGAPNMGLTCRERFSPGSGVFDTAQLDALVAATDSAR